MTATPRVVFGRAAWEWPWSFPEGPESRRLFANYVNHREVRVDSRSVGTLVGVTPAPDNAHRPTGYVFVPDDSPERVKYDRLESARERIATLYPTTATPNERETV